MPVMAGVRPSCLKYRVRKGSRHALAQEHRKLKVPDIARARLMSICLILFMVEQLRVSPTRCHMERFKLRGTDRKYIVSTDISILTSLHIKYSYLDCSYFQVSMNLLFKSMKIFLTLSWQGYETLVYILWCLSSRSAQTTFF